MSIRSQGVREVVPDLSQELRTGGLRLRRLLLRQSWLLVLERGAEPSHVMTRRSQPAIPMAWSSPGLTLLETRSIQGRSWQSEH